MYVKAINNIVIKYPYNYTDLLSDNPGTSFPEVMPNERLAEWNVFPVESVEKPICNLGEIVEEIDPICENNVWKQQWNVRPATQEETDLQATDIRTIRNRLLSDCDWTQLPDSTANKESWSIYRQQLRDVTSQVGFPWNITWPIPPEQIVSQGLD